MPKIEIRERMALELDLELEIMDLADSLVEAMVSHRLDRIVLSSAQAIVLKLERLKEIRGLE